MRTCRHAGRSPWIFVKIAFKTRGRADHLRLDQKEPEYSKLEQQKWSKGHEGPGGSFVLLIMRWNHGRISSKGVIESFVLCWYC